MPIRKCDEQICFVRLELLPGEILELLRKHAENYPRATECEEIGVALINSNFRPDDATAFIETVVRWGGGQRFVGRLLDQNDPDKLACALRDASALLQGGQTAAAVSRLEELRWLGQSFASKVARFLSPNTAVILDDVIRGALGYRATQEGYQEFLADCQAAWDFLVKDHTQLRICDVEAAIFAKIQGY